MSWPRNYRIVMTRAVLLLPLVLAALLALPLSTFAVPGIPHRLWGNATLAGAADARLNGMAITIQIPGVTGSPTQPANPTVSNGQYGISPNFLILADDLDTTTKEGARANDLVAILIDQAQVATVTFQNGTAQQLNLNVTNSQLLTPTVSPDPSSVPVNATVTASGIARDAAGTAVSGATVSIAWGDNTSATSTTSTTGGAYTANHAYAAVGTYTITVTASKSGYVRGTATTSVTVSTATAPALSVTVAPSPANTIPNVAVAASGLVSSSGTPIEGATVLIDWGDTATSQVLSGADGTYPITGITLTHQYAAAGTYNVTATASKSSYTSGSATTTVTVILPAGGGGGAPPPPPPPAPPPTPTPTPTPPATPENIQALPATQAAAALEAATTTQAAQAIQQVTSTKAAEVLQQVTTARAAEIVQQLTSPKAAEIVQLLTTTKAAEIVQQITPAKAAEVLSTIPTTRASQIMQATATPQLTQVIAAMSEASLTATLPGLTAAKISSIPAATLFAALPNAPTVQLVGAVPPTPPADLPAPVVQLQTPTMERFLAIRTSANEWVIIAATPAPLTKVLIKTRTALSNIENTVEVLSGPPAGLSTPPPGQTVAYYFTISIQNASPQQIAAGYIEFRLEKAWLAANNFHKWSVALHRFDTQLNAWMPLEAKVIAEDERLVHYSASTPAMSLFAITAGTASLSRNYSVDNLSLSSSTTAPGKPIMINATATSRLTEEKTVPITLWVNSTIEEVRMVKLPAGGSAPVSFSVSKSQTGTYQVRIDRGTASFSVTPGEAQPAAPGVWLYVAIAVVLAAAIAFFIIRRKKATAP